MRGWIDQAEIDSGRRPGVTSADHARIRQLEKENAELRRANEILKTASRRQWSGLRGAPGRGRVVTVRAGRGAPRRYRGSS